MLNRGEGVDCLVLDHTNLSVRIDAVITTRSRGGALERAVASVIAQTIPVACLIVVDDNSSETSERDFTRQLCKRAATRIPIRLIEADRSWGSNICRNAGIEAASSEYVAFLDDDDEWLDQKVEVLVSLLSQKSFGLIYSDYNIVDDTTGRVWTKHLPRARNLRQQLYRRNICAPTSGLVLRRDLGLRFDPEALAAQDYDLCLRAMDAGISFKHLKEPLFRYHIHSGGTITLNRYRRWSAVKNLYRLRSRIADRNPDLFKGRGRRELCLESITFFFAFGEYKRGTIFIKHYVKRWGIDWRIIRKVGMLCVLLTKRH